MSQPKAKCENSDSFLVAFKKARKKAHIFIGSKIKEYKLTYNQIDVLIFLMHNKDYNTAKDIVEYIGVSKGLVSRSVDGLIKRGFLTASEDEKDKRKLRLILTEDGNDLVKKIDKYDKEFFSKITLGVSKEEMEAHMSIMKKILNNLENINFD